MKPIKGCQQEEIWNHWKKIEKIADDSITWREDIRNPLPNDIKWFLVEIEEKDLPKIYIISSDDWKIITKSFKLLDAVRVLNSDLIDGKIKTIKEMKKIYEHDIDGLDRKFILVSPSVGGNFTIIEGNKRSMALQSINKLIGSQMYLGVSNKIRYYKWARYSK